MRRFFSPVLLVYASIYVLLTVVLTWPLVLHPGSLVPNDLGDSLLNMWLLAWDARTVPLSAKWWNAPQFYPMPGVLAFSEHLLGLSIISTPVIAATGNALLAYNAAFFLSFPLCALAAYFLGYAISKRHDVAFLAGLAFGFAPYRMSQFAHVQVLTAYWMPLALGALHRYLDTRHARWLVVFGAAWIMQALACGYYLIYLSVLVGLWLVWFAMGRERWGVTLRVVGTLGLSAALLSPVLYGYWKFQRAYGLRRWPEEIAAFSADIASLLKAPDNVWAWRWLDVVQRPESDLFPGLTIIVLILTALAIGWGVASRERVGSLRASRILVGIAAVFAIVAATPTYFGPWKIEIFGVKLLSVTSSYKPLSAAVALFAIACLVHPAVRTAWRRRSALAFYALAAVAMWLLCLGPTPTLMNEPAIYKAPYSWLMMLPGVDGVRVPARFWVLATLCLAVAAGLALRQLSARWPKAARAVPVLASCLVVAEAWPMPIKLWEPPPLWPSHTRAVARLELPVTPVHDLRALYRAIYHRRPLLNGYSGYFAPHYWALQYLLEQHDPGVLTRLSAFGPIEVVVDHAEDRDGQWRTFLRAHPQAEQVYSDEAYTSFRIAPGERVQPLPEVPGPVVAIQSLRAEANQGLTGAMIDGDIISRWHAGRAQAPGDFLTADLGATHEITGVRMLIGGYVADFPRKLTIETSLDGQAWTEAWTGNTSLMAFSAALEDPGRITLPFPFAARPARYVRFTQTGTEGTYYWSIAELQIVGR